MNRNESYKNSGVEWIGEIPKHWQIKKFGYVSVIKTGNTPSKTQEELFFTEDNNGYPWVKPSDLDVGFDGVITSETKLTLEGRYQSRVVPKNSILLCCIGTSGKYSISNRDLSTNQQINSIIFNDEVIPRYGLFFMDVFGRDLLKRINSVTLSMISKGDLSREPIIVPPIKEQKIISRYLDKKTKQIDSLIKKIQKKIELLKEQRTSLINQCITKGLTPNVRMRDSGIEWIGEIPKHWKMSKIKYNSGAETGSTPKSEVMSYWNGKIRWYTPTDFKSIGKNGFIRNPSRFITQKGLSNSGCSFIDKDAVLLTTRAPVGNVGKIKKNFTFNQGCKSLIPKENLDISYLYFYLKTVTEPLNVIANGTTFTELSIQNLLNFKIPLPPLEEQKFISHYLNKKTEQIDLLVEKIQKKIEFLKEYRQSLISSVVTGKIRITEDMV